MSLDESQQEKVAQFVSVANLEAEVATKMLIRANWELEQAVDNYYNDGIPFDIDQVVEQPTFNDPQDPLDPTWEQPLLTWDLQNCHHLYTAKTTEYEALTQGNMTYFPSIRTTPALQPGKKYYVEVVIFSNSPHVKVGVTQEQDLDKDHCFSDTQQGWSYYISESATRNSSNYNGQDYPAQNKEENKYKYGTIMGIYVDLIDYNVSYKFDGKYHGQAYGIPEGSEYHIAYGHYDHGHDAK